MQFDIFYTKVLTLIYLKFISLENILIWIFSIKIYCMRDKEYTKWYSSSVYVFLIFHAINFTKFKLKYLLIISRYI